MTKKQFYYFIRIIETCVATAVLSIGIMLYPNVEAPPLKIVISIVILAVLAKWKIRSYVKKAFGIESPEKDEQKDLKNLEENEKNY